MDGEVPAPDSLVLRELQPGDNTKKLSLGKVEFQPLKSYLRNIADKFHKTNIAKTYVLVPDGESSPRVWGYITFTCSQISLEGSYFMSDCKEANKYEALPAVKIARLAVDKEIKGNGHGSTLIDFAIWFIIDSIMPNVGCRFLITDAKKDAVKFYEKTGFTMLDTPGNKRSTHPVMFVDLHKLANTSP